MSDSSRPHGLQPPRLLYPWDFPGKSTGVGCHCLLQQQPLAAHKFSVPFLTSRTNKDASPKTSHMMLSQATFLSFFFTIARQDPTFQILLQLLELHLLALLPLPKFLCLLYQSLCLPPRSISKVIFFMKAIFIPLPLRYEYFSLNHHYSLNHFLSYGRVIQLFLF